MTRAQLLLLGLAAVLAVSAIGPAPAVAATISGSRGPPVELSIDRSKATTRLGGSFGFSSRVTNVSSAQLTGLVAHLDVVSLRKGVYVDPEDWSSERTRYLGSLGPDDSADIAWKVKSVNGGDFGVYVVVLPGRSATGRGEALAVSPAVDLHVSERKTINPGGVLPLALGVPAFLGLLALGARRRRAR